MCGFNYDLAEARSESGITPAAIADIARRKKEGEGGTKK